MARRRVAPVRPLRRHEREYEARLRREVLNPVRDNLRAKLRQAQAISAALGALAEDPLAGFAIEAVSEIVLTHFARVNRYHRDRLRKAFASAVGVDIRPFLTEPAVQQALGQRVVENVDLVKTIPQRFHEGLAKRLQRELAEAPFDQQRVMGLLAEEYRSSGYNLRRLTRDQTSKAIGQLTQMRHNQLGIERYQWQTAGDERVRPSHVSNDGLYFWWSKPPATGHPGSAIQCRCVPVPVVTPEDMDRLGGVEAPDLPIPDRLPDGRPTRAAHERAYRHLQRDPADAVNIEYANQQALRDARSTSRISCGITWRAEPAMPRDPRCGQKGRSLVYHGTDRMDWQPHKGTHFTPEMSAAENYSRAGFHEDGWVHVLEVDDSELARGMTLVPDSLTDTDTADDIATFLQLFPEAADADLVTYADAVLGGSGRDITTFKPLTEEAAQRFAQVDSFENGYYFVDSEQRAVARLSYQDRRVVGLDAEHEYAKKLTAETAERLGVDPLDMDEIVAVSANEWYEYGGTWMDDAAPDYVRPHMRAGAKISDLASPAASPAAAPPVAAGPLPKTLSGWSEGNPHAMLFDHFKRKYGLGDVRTVTSLKNGIRWEIDQNQELTDRIKQAMEIAGL